MPVPTRGEAPLLTPICRARPIYRCCNRRPALARVRGGWKVVKHHDLCRQCWRSFMDACAASELAYHERIRAEQDSRRRGTLRASRARASNHEIALAAVSRAAERALRAR